MKRISSMEFYSRKQLNQIIAFSVIIILTIVSCYIIFQTNLNKKLRSYSYAQYSLMEYAVEQMNTVSPNTGKDAIYSISEDLTWSWQYQAFTAKAYISWMDRLDWFSSPQKCILWGTIIVNHATGRFEFIPYAKNTHLNITKPKYQRNLEVYDYDE